MTDDIDRANDRAAQMLADAMAAQARRARQRLGAVSAALCQDCEVPIPLARQQAIPGVQCCVQCAALNERKERATA